jgi:hypothetical protein
MDYVKGTKRDGSVLFESALIGVHQSMQRSCIEKEER